MSELLTVAEAAKRLKLSESHLHKLRARGGSPEYVRLGRAVRYRPEDLDAWVEARRAGGDAVAVSL
jgi:excisionase family DNA binding protein